MNNKKEKKEIVITGRKVLKIIAILAVLAATVNVVVSIASGVPILEAIIDPIWAGALVPVFIVFVIGDEKDKKSASPKDKV